MKSLLFAEAGILRHRNVGRQRYRVFEATAVLDLFTSDRDDTNHKIKASPT